MPFTDPITVDQLAAKLTQLWKRVNRAEKMLRKNEIHEPNCPFINPPADRPMNEFAIVPRDPCTCWLSQAPDPANP